MGIPINNSKPWQLNWTILVGVVCTWIPWFWRQIMGWPVALFMGVSEISSCFLLETGCWIKQTSSLGHTIILSYGDKFSSVPSDLLLNLLWKSFAPKKAPPQLFFAEFSHFLFSAVLIRRCTSSRKKESPISFYPLSRTFFFCYSAPRISFSLETF